MRDSILSKYLDPDVVALLDQQLLQPRGLVAGNLAGRHKSALAGFAVEFSGHRQYVPGDDPKHIDWRVYFTRDRYVVKQYELETNLVCHLLLDISASMRYGEGDQQKLAYAQRISISLGHCILRQADKVALSTFDDQIRGTLPPSHTMDQILRMTQHLDHVEPVQKTDLGRCLSELAGRMGRRAIVLILSDFFGDLDSLEAAVQCMRYNRHEVVLMQVLHHDELVFPFERFSRFVGLEGDEQLRVEPGDVRDAYLEALARRHGRLEDIVQRNRIERVLLDTSNSISKSLVDYLCQRQKMRRYAPKA